jgi:hypothetical protein
MVRAEIVERMLHEQYIYLPPLISEYKKLLKLK